MKSPFTKPWLSVPEQIKRLESYGLVIPDPEAAANFLKHINYYRFAGYALAFEGSRHQFPEGTNFQQIRDAYMFDRQVRDLFYSSIEVIELDLRAAVAYHFGQQYGPLGHTCPDHFFNGFRHGEWLSKIHNQTSTSREPFVSHFKRNHREFPNLPIWVVTEIMSFGSLSKMISGMLKADTKKLAARYRMQPRLFVSVVHHLVYVRNVCAHHARIWDREWQIKPELPAGSVWRPPFLPSNERLFVSLLLQYSMLLAISAEQDWVRQWHQRVEQLIDFCIPSCSQPLVRMGFPADWKSHPLWTKHKI